MKICQIDRNSFRALSSSYYMSNTKKQIEISNHIEEELKKPYPKSRKGKSYLQVYEKKGFNIFLNQGKSEDSVEVHISPINKKENFITASPTFLVGEYDNAESFDVEQVDEVFRKNKNIMNNSNYSKIGIGALLAGLVAAALSCAVYFKNKNQHYPKENTVTIVTDTLSRDGVALRDTFNFIK